MQVLKQILDYFKSRFSKVPYTIENLSAKLKLQLLPFSVESLKSDESAVFYMGLANIKVLRTIFDQVHTMQIHAISRIYVHIIKAEIKQSNSRFGISFLYFKGNCFKNYFKVANTDEHQSSRTNHMARLWEFQKNYAYICFQESFGKKVAIIVDCFEIFLERPSNLQARAYTWLNYKHKNIVKVLIEIVPQGSVAFSSEGWGGHVSDKYITEHSGILSKLLCGDIVLADCGFDVVESVGVQQAKLPNPAFTKAKGQLSALEIEETRNRANVQIHVERVIGLVQQKYTILQYTLPIHFVTKRVGENIPLIDRMICVLCTYQCM